MDAGFSEREFQSRKAALLEECELAPQVFEDVSPRLEQFMESFVDSLARKEQVGHALTFVRGLLSDLDHRNVESIAYRFGQERLPLQWFIGVSKWDDQPLREELTRQIARDLGIPTACWSLIPRRSPSRAASRSVLRGNGADGWARWKTARWRCTWVTCRATNIRSSTRDCTCPRSGPRTKRG